MAGTSVEDIEKWSAEFVKDVEDDWLSIFTLSGIETHPPGVLKEEIAELRVISREMRNILREIHTINQPGRERFDRLRLLNEDYIRLLVQHYSSLIPDEDEEELIEIPSYNDIISDSLFQWLTDGAEDLEDKLIVITYALLKTCRDDLQNKYPDPNNYFEDVVWIRSREMEINSIENDHLVWIDTNGQRVLRKWLNVISLEQDKAPPYDNGSIISNIIEFNPQPPAPVKEKQLSPVRVFVPFKELDVGVGHEIVLIKLDKNGRWKDMVCDKDEEYEALVFTNKHLWQKITLTVVHRLVVDKKPVGPLGAKINSSVNPEIKLDIPSGMFEAETSDVQLQVEETSDVTSDLQQLAGVSPLVHVTTDAHANQPITVQVPLSNKDGSPAQMNSSLNIQAVVRNEEDLWQTETQIQSLKNGIATVQVKLPEQRSALLLMQIPKQTSQQQAQNLARIVDERLHSHTAVVLFRQHHKDERNALVKVSKIEDAETDLEVMEKKGFTLGPCMDMTSQFVVQDRQTINMFFTKSGCIQLMGSKMKTIRFNPSMGSQMVNFKLVVDPVPPPGRDIDGVFRVEVDRGEGQEVDGDIELVVTLPQEASKCQSSKSASDGIPTQDPGIERTRRDMEQIANCIKDMAGVRRKWKFIGRKLGVSEADIEEIDHLHRYPPEKVFQMLVSYAETKGRDACKKEVISVLVVEGLRAAAEATAFPSSVETILGSDNDTW